LSGKQYVRQHARNMAKKYMGLLAELRKTNLNKKQSGLIKK